MATNPTATLAVEVADVQAEARDVLVLELRDPHGAPLPAFEPGAHVELRLPNGLVRHYSLVNDWRETHRYVIAVGRAADGRGGSAYVHGSIRCGMPLVIGAPRNNFRLDPAAARYRFVAGGIGVTPIVSMARWCEANGRPWRLVYAARSRQRAAFYEALRALAPQRVRFHFDDERDAVLDVAGALADLDDGEQVYCCGPQPLMRAVEAATAALPPGRVHFEWFAVPDDAVPGPASDLDGASVASGAAAGSDPSGVVAEARSGPDGAPAADRAFRIELRRSGRSFEVPPQLSILEVLEANGFEVPFSCREGLCRTCETNVCDGEPEHRDYVLSQQERAAGRSMMVCVSRARSATLGLDL